MSENEQEQDHVHDDEPCEAELENRRRQFAWQSWNLYLFTVVFHFAKTGCGTDGSGMRLSFFFFMSMHEMLYTPPLTNFVTFETEFDNDALI